MMICAKFRSSHRNLLPRYATLGIHTGLPIYQTSHLGSTQVPYYQHRSHTNGHTA